MADFWEQTLLEASLGYVEFPVADRSVKTGRNFARNIYSYRDGQGVEDTGRKVYQFSLTVPLFRAVDEAHYPDTYLRLVAIIEDPELRGEVEYVDPEFGALRVKILDYDWRTVAERRDGGVLTIQLEELGFEQSLLDDLSAPPASATRAEALAVDVDMQAAELGEEPGFSLTATWQAFQASLDEGALRADEIAARLDEVYLVAEKAIAYSSRDELQRWSLYNSVIDFLGAAEDVAGASADRSAGAKLLEVVLPDDMDMFQIADRYLRDAGRAEEVSFHNPGDPLAYRRGQAVRVPAS